jgi:hypothetical protein
MAYKSKTFLYRDLTDKEEIEFRQWARENFCPTTEPISPVWHPIVRDECRKIVEEMELKRISESDQSSLSFDDYDGIKDAYEKAILHNLESFEYKERFFLTGYAKYLLQYMEMRKVN